MECFYDLYEDLQNNLELSSNIIEVHKQNNGRILEFILLSKMNSGLKINKIITYNI